MIRLPRNVRCLPDSDGDGDETPTPPPVAVAPIHTYPVAPEALSAAPTPNVTRSSSPLWTVAPFLVTAITVALLVSRALAGTPSVAVPTWRSVLDFGRSVAASSLTRAALPAHAVEPAALFAAPDAAPVEHEPPPRIEHQGYGSIPGGVLFTPDSFAPTGSDYDLLLHFHGNTRVVRESAEVAGLNAAVAVVNLGVGSGPYEVAYIAPGTYEALLEEINRVIALRGVPSPRLRRVALSSWSAGYGAISKILEMRRGADPLDALLVLDGIHTGWLEGSRTHDLAALNPLHLDAFARAARRASSGDFLFSITHADIDPIAYAGTSLTADYLLREAAGQPLERTAPGPAPAHLALRSAEGAVAKRLEKRLEPTSDTRLGDLHVRGYTGNTPEHHMSHLLQMGATVIPELVSRWSSPAIR
ncbi:hypothetical protein [Chondromyces apiculatus]|uniref:Uncharacterized protein n=1 Tax=Chondromyces apiculatus DSM 436 TaxID=1192034 RepID=A0A017T102_9BACT|nr:hypothetical protein [Chondromyces apiculatus]EYF02903.1 Hypothetical protein CAP_6326 [Chondromyces apiculatus DSM 436]